MKSPRSTFAGEGNAGPASTSRIRWAWLGSLFLLLLAGYVGLFASWWTSSPSRIVQQAGGPVRVVEFHSSRLFWRTRWLWIPAHLVVEHVLGYAPVRMVAAGPDSVVTYVKPLPADPAD